MSQPLPFYWYRKIKQLAFTFKRWRWRSSSVSREHEALGSHRNVCCVSTFFLCSSPSRAVVLLSFMFLTKKMSYKVVVCFMFLLLSFWLIWASFPAFLIQAVNLLLLISHSSKGLEGKQVQSANSFTSDVVSGPSPSTQQSPLWGSVVRRSVSEICFLLLLILYRRNLFRVPISGDNVGSLSDSYLF